MARPAARCHAHCTSAGAPVGPAPAPPRHPPSSARHETADRAAPTHRPAPDCRRHGRCYPSAVRSRPVRRKTPARRRRRSASDVARSRTGPRCPCTASPAAASAIAATGAETIRARRHSSTKSPRAGDRPPARACLPRSLRGIPRAWAKSRHRRSCRSPTSRVRLSMSHPAMKMRRSACRNARRTAPKKAAASIRTAARAARSTRHTFRPGFRIREFIQQQRGTAELV